MISWFFSPSQAATQDAYNFVEKQLAALQLRYEPRKTRIRSFDEGFRFVGVDFVGNTYEYTWEGKRVEVCGKEIDWLFSRYGPAY